MIPITFEQCADDLLNPTATPVATPEEIAAIRAAITDDAARLAALKVLAAPRYEYAWRQAGGRAHHEFTAEQMAEAADHFARQRLARATKESNHG